MPGPVVYVAVGICAVVAVVAFKEFVYDPHIGPELRRWREEMRERRRYRQQRRLHEPFSARRHDDDDSSTSPSSRSSSDASSNPDPGSSIELNDLLEREAEAWRARGAQAGTGTGLRHRNVPASNQSAPQNILDDHEPLGQSTLAVLQPTPSAPQDTNVLFEYPASPTLSPVSSPSPSTSSLTLSSNFTVPSLPPTPQPPQLSTPQTQTPMQALEQPQSPTSEMDPLSASTLTSINAYFSLGNSPNSTGTPGTPVPLSPAPGAGTLSPPAGAISPFTVLSPNSEPVELSASGSDGEMFSGSDSGSDGSGLDGPGLDDLGSDDPDFDSGFDDFEDIVSLVNSAH
ncbi:hypothetical protein K488DRAFT_85007 [Vararia minispora EC-137]|uniref:Uncharacterized protein n=1 Tax=Vararia minispora EC-137 TaxID=1314806 RepID=A0ACB8QNR8_9AGAM|nr:hypothetical protein K488DRAFT_85007 [Vararia minispora EC-137]